MWHIWIVRCRYESVFLRNPFRNVYMNYGVVIEIAIGVTVVFMPGVQTFFGSANPPAVGLVPNLFFGLALLVISEYLKHKRKTNPHAFGFLAY